MHVYEGNLELVVANGIEHGMRLHKIASDSDVSYAMDGMARRCSGHERYATRCHALDDHLINSGTGRPR